jgi:hypothetical protein
MNLIFSSFRAERGLVYVYPCLRQGIFIFGSSEPAVIITEEYVILPQNDGINSEFKNLAFFLTFVPNYLSIGKRSCFKIHRKQVQGSL